MTTRDDRRALDARIVARHETGESVTRIAAAERQSVPQVRAALARYAATPEFARTIPTKVEVGQRIAALRAAVTPGPGEPPVSPDLRAAGGQTLGALAALDRATPDVEPALLPDAPVHGDAESCTCEDRIEAAIATDGTTVRLTGAAMTEQARSHRALARANAAETAVRAEPAPERAPHPNSARARRLSSTATGRRAVVIA